MNRIKEVRKAHKMTQVRLASLVGVSQGTISAYEAGTVQVDTETLTKLSDLFGVSTDYLLGRGEDEPSPGSSASGWNVEYPAGVALHTQPQPSPAPAVALSKEQLTFIAEQVAQLNRDAKTTPVLNSSEQQLIEEYRLLNSAGRLRVQRLISVLLDNKFNGE